MNQCSYCSFEAKNKAGLSAHERACKTKNNTPSEPVMPEVPPPQMNPSEDCPHCSLLPAGSVNITSMFIVVVFCLTAVLFTAMFKIDMQNAEIRALQAELAATYEADGV